MNVPSMEECIASTINKGRAHREPRCQARVKVDGGEIVMRLVSPEEEVINIWVAPKAARRLVEELTAALEAVR